MSSGSNFPSLNTLFASITAGLTGTLVYHLIKSKLSNNEFESSNLMDSIIHLEIPRETVGHLIGRDGSNIKETEERTSTSITFLDEGGPFRIAVLRGSKDGVLLAKQELKKSIDDFAQLETSEIFVSEEVIVQLSSNCKQKMKEIAAISNARIYIDEVQEKPSSLLVRGTYNQIEKVRECLKQMVTSDVLSEAKVTSPLKSPSQMTDAKRQGSRHENMNYERLEPTSSDGYCEVMVSFVESPSKFFVQKCGTLSKELDCLIKNMTDHYSKAENQYPYQTSKFEVGCFVACLAPDDDCWYRAVVILIDVDDENGLDEKAFSVKLVDFGDQLLIKQRYVAHLLPEFLSIRYQAIECTLHNVKPSGDGKWTDKAIEEFETLTYCTQWKILMAKIESKVQVDGSSIPSLKLVDTNTPKDVDIASKLISLGYAISN